MKVDQEDSTLGNIDKVIPASLNLPNLISFYSNLFKPISKKTPHKIAIISLPLIGLPPSVNGGFHFIVTELASNLSIRASRGSPGASEEVKCFTINVANLCVI